MAARNTTKYVNAAHKAPQQVHFSVRRDTRENPWADAPARTTRRLSSGHLKNLTKSHAAARLAFLTSDNVPDDGVVFKFSARLSRKLRVFEFRFLYSKFMPLGIFSFINAIKYNILSILYLH